MRVRLLKPLPRANITGRLYSMNDYGRINIGLQGYDKFQIAKLEEEGYVEVLEKIPVWKGETWGLHYDQVSQMYEIKVKTENGIASSFEHFGEDRLRLMVIAPKMWDILESLAECDSEKKALAIQEKAIELMKMIWKP